MAGVAALAPPQGAACYGTPQVPLDVSTWIYRHGSIDMDVSTCIGMCMDLCTGTCTDIFCMKLGLCCLDSPRALLPTVWASS